MRKYFGRLGNRSWWFFGTKSETGPNPEKVWIFRAAYVPIQVRKHFMCILGITRARFQLNRSIQVFLGRFAFIECRSDCALV